MEEEKGDERRLDSEKTKFKTKTIDDVAIYYSVSNPCATFSSQLSVDALEEISTAHILERCHHCSEGREMEGRRSQGRGGGDSHNNAHPSTLW